MLIALAVWLLAGAFFGWSRARARYWAAINHYSALMKTQPGSVKREAFADAVVELTKWTLLGFISGITLIAWILAQHAERESKKRGNTLDGVGWSVATFVLGSVALDDRLRSDGVPAAPCRTRIDEESRDYKDGRLAFANSVSKENNPHQERDSEYGREWAANWDAGWESATSDRQRLLGTSRVAPLDPF